MHLAHLETVRHKPCKLKFNPYLDADYQIYLQHQRDVQKHSGKYRAVWTRQSGLVSLCQRGYFLHIKSVSSPHTTISTRQNASYTIRFADDIIITARSQEQASLILDIACDFLGDRGLRMNHRNIIHKPLMRNTTVIGLHVNDYYPLRCIGSG